MWVSATAAGRLLTCPVSVAPRANPTIPTATTPNNAGSLAHLALGVWLESGGWKGKDPGTALHAAWDAEAARWGVNWRRLREGVVVRARLGLRAADLAQLIKNAGIRARSEVFLTDRATGIYGALDVIVDGGAGGGAVIDLKSGRDVVGDLDAAARVQLLMYAHLFRREYGQLPATLIAFSLIRGALPIEFSLEEVDELIERVGGVRALQDPVATPGQAVCRYCSRRLRCEPHWVAAEEWSKPDCLEGQLTKIERAAAGMTAIRLKTPTASEWVTNLDAQQAANARAIGERVRVVRVTKRRDTEWVASPVTRIATHSSTPD
ncbi:PD-(D/E)XK nuclease family protein [Microbacterium testaceum]|nr:PD-(D/E)XK nuclease family protein [Microbacterium testaceum]